MRESLRIAKVVYGEESVEAARNLIDLSGIDQDRGRWAVAEAPLLSAIDKFGNAADSVNVKIENYLLAIGVSSAEIASLRANLIEPPIC